MWKKSAKRKREHCWRKFTHSHTTKNAEQKKNPGVWHILKDKKELNLKADIASFCTNTDVKHVQYTLNSIVRKNRFRKAGFAFLCVLAFGNFWRTTIEQWEKTGDKERNKVHFWRSTPNRHVLSAVYCILQLQTLISGFKKVNQQHYFPMSNAITELFKNIPWVVQQQWFAFKRRGWHFFRK